MKMGRAGAPFEPRRRPQAGKSGDSRSQNADSSPRAQGAPGLGRAERRKGKGEAPRALTACVLGRRVAVDWTWAALFPHAPLSCALLGGLVVAHSRSPSCCSSVLCSSSLRTPAPASNPISNLLPPSHFHGSDEEGEREETHASVSPAAIGGPCRRPVDHTQSGVPGQGQLGSGYHLQLVWEDDGLAYFSLPH